MALHILSQRHFHQLCPQSVQSILDFFFTGVRRDFVSVDVLLEKTCVQSGASRYLPNIQLGETRKHISDRIAAVVIIFHIEKTLVG